MDHRSPRLVERLNAVRAHIAATGAHGLLVPESDEHASEYVPSYARRLRWLTGFTGSAGTAVVLATRAVLCTDGRYALQARDEVDPAAFDVREIPAMDAGRWLSDHAPHGARILFDPWLTTPATLKRLRARMRPDLVLEAVRVNPIDAFWTDRPSPSSAPLEVHPLAHAGVASAEKRASLAAALRDDGSDAVVIAALDSIAWLFNVRGADIAHNPVTRAFAIVRSDGRAVLFVDLRKVSETVRAHFGSDVTVLPYERFADELAALTDTVEIDPDTCVQAIADSLVRCRVRERPDRCVLPRATKNDVEIAGMRAAHLRDGIALARFLGWIESAVRVEPVDERDAAAMLRRLREASGHLRDLSFATISATGPSGAQQHYVPKPGSARRIAGDTLYLVDSGAQYVDGTTDVTRTVVIGVPTHEMRMRFTQALRGHVAIASLRFPEGTTGGDLDALARQFLWQDRVDYASGTGHGVGSYLSVHEGPVFIGRRGGTRVVDAPIRARMILSIEPGFYLPDAWGLRTENLYLVVDDGRDERGVAWLRFEALTLAPIDRRLIDLDEMSRAERRWLDAYHALVRDRLAPHLAAEDSRWLDAACRPLAMAAADAPIEETTA